MIRSYVVLLLLAFPALSWAKSLPGIEYVSPEPGAAQILEPTNIVLRPGGIVDGTSIGNGRLVVTGSISGVHTGKLRLSDDHETMTFQPDAPFVPGETVVCAIKSGIRTDKLGDVPPAQFTFTIAGPDRDAIPPLPPFPAGEDLGSPGPAKADTIPAPPPPPPLPADFPHVTAFTLGPTAPGRLFLANFNFNGFTPNPYLMIVNNDGSPHFQRKLPDLALDFKRQPDGRLTYYDNAARCFYALDATYTVVDSFRTGNGYVTDGHDLVLRSNGHALLMSYDPEIVDLNPIKMGLGTGVAVGLIIQELDEDRAVVFQWRSWDHFKITDAIARTSFGGGLDIVHGNSLDVGPDGNIIVSCRAMSEVTKIDRTTGDILWRMGGKNNQFTFVNDPFFFSLQHDAKWLPDGNLTLFDNGNFRLPLFSRAVEYALDEAQKTAALVWQYRMTPDVFGGALGSVQRLPNGNTLISWGATTPTLTEVTPDGAIVAQLSLDPGVYSYRSFRYVWPPEKPAAVVFKPGSIRKGWTSSAGISAVVEPVSGSFDPLDVDLATVRLNGVLPTRSTQLVVGDVDLDGIPDLSLRFSRAAVDAMVILGTNRLEVTGSLRSGEIFRGSGDLRVLPPTGIVKAAGVQVLSPAGALPVEMAAGGRTVSIYDVQGRLVRRWRSEAGGSVTWDGRGGDGRPAAAGIYFARGEEGGPGSTAKIVVVR